MTRLPFTIILNICICAFSFAGITYRFSTSRLLAARISAISSSPIAAAVLHRQFGCMGGAFSLISMSLTLNFFPFSARHTSQARLPSDRNIYHSKPFSSNDLICTSVCTLASSVLMSRSASDRETLNAFRMSLARTCGCFPAISPCWSCLSSSLLKSTCEYRCNTDDGGRELCETR